jgi:hypothetical protein
MVILGLLWTRQATLLVGKTAQNASTVGAELGSSGWVAASRAGNTAGFFNRTTSDGEIVRLTKDGTTVGSIGIGAGALGIGKGTGNLGFFDASAVPMGNISGGASDGVITLGNAGRRFKDLYLSGGVYLGGTTSDNLLDDYEIGTWTGKVADAASGGNESPSSVYGTYTKIGRVVYVQFNVSNIDTTGLTAGNDVYITGLPFATRSVTGNAKFTATAHISIVTFSGTPFLNADESATVLRIGENNSGAGVDYVTMSELSSGASDIHGNLCYETA